MLRSSLFRVIGPLRLPGRGRFAAGLLSLGLALTLASCGQGEGERCQLTSDCESGLMCSNLNAPGVDGECQPMNQMPIPMQDATVVLPSDGGMTRADAGADGGAGDGGPDTAPAIDASTDASADAPGADAAGVDASGADTAVNPVDAASDAGDAGNAG